MAGDIPLLRITRKADAAFDAATMRGRAMVPTAANGCALAVANSQGVIGILSAAAKITEAAPICVSGTIKVRAGAAFAVGARLAPDAAGKLITQAGAVGSGLPVVAIALQAAGAADEMVEALLTPGATI
jgi:hypothetical protein